ncbi:hypothetical protein BG015_007885 [Linnemannia schmuckeri]|uniref:F-box domain-containing protein n=1 Tax=Linnemannia schmuckeri TaxID=64567 RepID=A0A9P5RXT8_9FUNG|nr:hypothetical protein BG015_007885 [Linnemannia schmuckeri]
MTEPVYKSFFTLPEVVDRLTYLLTKQDLIHLSQTNHHINSICTPTVWREVDLSRFWVHQRFLNSSASLEAFRDNIETIRSINWNERASWWYINALWSYLNSSATITEAHKAIPTDVLLHPK